MRRRNRLEQNTSLFEQLNDARAEILRLKKEVEKQKIIIDSLSGDESINNTSTALHSRSVPSKKVKALVLSDDKQYASNAIGKLVVESANYSNILTAGGETKYKELVNLILGRTEVAKSEIFAVILEKIEFDLKKQKIDAIKEETSEYFKSIMAQR